jgi:TatD DNase family protein
VPHTVRFMADLLGDDLDEFCAQLAANTVAVYGSWHDEAVLGNEARGNETRGDAAQGDVTRETT